MARPIPERLLRPSEFQLSREEALFEMITGATFVGWLGGKLRRLVHCLASYRGFRKWQVLVNGKSVDEQLLTVRSPRGGLTHGLILAWTKKAIPLGGYDPRNMPTEWHKYWRRKGV
jgi:hypothetical protein